MTVFCENLRRLRLGKKLTQEQAAQALGVSAQSVSRWECGTTLPDVTMLPAIARLFCVTIDDLYQQTPVAYENYAARLCSVFEATKQPEDFLRADQEYKKLLKTGEYTMEDLRSYGILHQYMMEVCMEKAEALFDRVLTRGGWRRIRSFIGASGGRRARFSGRLAGTVRPSGNFCPWWKGEARKSRIGSA